MMAFVRSFVRLFAHTLANEKIRGGHYHIIKIVVGNKILCVLGRLTPAAELDKTNLYAMPDADEMTTPEKDGWQ